MMFRFYINGTEIQNHPDGWDKIISEVKRDDITGILLLDSQISLTFYGGQDGYTILKNGWTANHVGESYIDIQQRFPNGQYGLVHSGTIFHSSIKFNLVNGSLTFRTEDRGFYAMINNNKKIETDLTGGKTKNGIAIAPCPSFTLTVHNVNNGNPKHTVTAFKMIDVLKYLVQFMTDNRMTLESSCFDVGGSYEGICLVNGHELAVHNNTKKPILSWETLTNELSKRLNVQFSVVGAIDNPVINVDSFTNFYGGFNALEIPTIPREVELSTDENRLYSCVEVGSDKIETDSNLHFPDVYALTSFRTESFHFIGTNNIDRKLDLVGKFVISNAAIEVVTNQLSGWEGYDEDIFMIQYNVGANTSYQSNWVGSTIAAGYFYNEMFNNQNILSRWSASFPNEISITSFSPSANSFKAVRTDTSPIASFTEDDSKNWATLLIEIGFNIDYPSGGGYDPSNNYGGGTTQGSPVSRFNSYFTAPVNGFYSFNASVQSHIEYYTDQYRSSIIYPRWKDKHIGLRFTKMDSGGIEINHRDSAEFVVVDSWRGALPTVDQSGPMFAKAQNFTLNHSWGTFMNAGEKMKLSYFHYVRNQTGNADKNHYTITDQNGYFMCDNILTGGGVVSPADPTAYKSLKIDFEYPLNLDQYNQLILSKQGLIQVPINDTQKLNGWVQNVKFDHNSGMTKFSLITDGNTIYR